MSVFADMDGDGDMDIIFLIMMTPLLGMRAMVLDPAHTAADIATDKDGQLLSLQQIWTRWRYGYYIGFYE